MSGLVMDTPRGDRVVRWVRPDAIAVGGQELRGSFAVSADGPIQDWPVASADGLDAAALDRLLEAQPELVVLGTGERRASLSPALQYQVLSKGVGLEVMDNGAAARTYNLLLGEGRRVLAAFILPAPG